MGATATIVATGSRLDLVVLGVLLAVAAFLVAAYRTGVPYPILLVCGGAVIGFLPGVPATGLNPDLVILIFLPPLLYAAAFFSSLRDLRANRSGPWLRHCPPPDRDDRHPRIPPAHATRPRHNSSGARDGAGRAAPERRPVTGHVVHHGHRRRRPGQVAGKGAHDPV